jgi:PAS domain S-box-containing protein
VERSEQLEREGVAMREALDEARKQANAADETAERAQSEAESAHGDAAQAIRLVRDLERQTQEVRGQLTQARGDSGEGAKRLAALERANEGAADRLARLEQKARDETESARLDKLERDAESLREALDEARSQQAPADLGERLDDALDQLAETRRHLSEAPAQTAEPVDSAAVQAEVDAAVERLQQLRTESEELAGNALESLRSQGKEVAEAARAAGSEATGARAAADEARAEASRSAEEAARAREELAEMRQELAATQAEVSETKAELTELRELVAGVREASATARAEAEAAGQSGREAGEQAGSAAQRSQEIAARLAEIAEDVERVGAEHASEREEFATLKTQAEEVLRLLERSVGRALTGAPVADDLSERPAGPAQPEPDVEPEPTRETREGFDEVEAPMAMLDLEGRFLELNASFCELVGYSEEEFQSAIWPSSLSDDATRKEHRELRGRLATGEIEESPIETCYLHKEGLMVPVSGTVSLVRGDDGQPDHLLLSGATDRAALSA